MILNDEQKKVVESNERFLFLLASAGSGKTRVIIEKIRHLIDKNADPSRILAITFTRKAAMEMRTRLNDDRVHIHTFHQYCYLGLLEQKTEAFSMADETLLPFSKSDLLACSKYKNSLYQTRKPRMYEAYQTYLKMNHLFDFDDLLIEFNQSVVLKKVAPLFDHIFIDEFQDTNNLQYALLKNLIGKKTSVLAVGDPDQSIYAFRGANSKIIYRFIKDYHATLMTLSVNYRSNHSIITHANRLIKRNNRKYRKSMIAYNQTENKPIHIRFDNDIEEAFFIMTIIKSLIRGGIRHHEIAVIYRNRYRAFELRKVMMENEISISYEQDEEMKKDQIQFLTIHKAKGLEFDVVIILGLEEGTFPSMIQNSQVVLDEERRLMFVAMTRARSILYLSSIRRNDQNHSFTYSRFISESGVKTMKKKHINDIISLGDFNGRQAKNSRTDQNSESSEL